jgi:membrane protease YdiL (CAAX protease family)
MGPDSGGVDPAMSQSPVPGARAPRRRPLEWLALLGLLAAFLFGPAIVDVAVLRAESGAVFPDQASVNVLIIGQATALLVALAGVQLFGWWRPVLQETRRVRPWVWVVPIALLIVHVAFTDYGRLAEAGIALSASLLLGTTLVAAGEELLYRGVVLTFMRERYRETMAAVVTALVFGLCHAPGGPLNMVSAAVHGYLLYYARRVSGGLVVPIVLHSLYDFSVYSSATTAHPDPAGNASPANVLVALVLLVVMVVLHRRAEPRPSAAPPIDSNA